MDIALEARSLTYHFKNEPVFKGIHFQINQGAKVSFLTESKIHLNFISKLLQGQILPTAGELVVLGHNTKDELLEVKKKISIVDSNESFDERFQTREYLEVYSSYYGLNDKNQKLNILDALRKSDLEDKDEEVIFNFNELDRRKLLLSRALVTKPRIIFFNNITAGLNIKEQEYMWELINKLKDITMIFFSNNSLEVEELSEEVYFLKNGVISLSGKPEDLVDKYVGKEVVEFSISKREFIYFSKRLENKYEFIFDEGVLKVFINKGQDGVSLLNLISGESVNLRKPNISDVYLKTIHPNKFHLKESL